MLNFFRNKKNIIFIAIIVVLMGIIVYIKFIDKDNINSNDGTNNVNKEQEKEKVNNIGTNKAIDINLNETITIDDVCSLTIENIDFTTSIKYSNDNSVSIKNKDNIYIIISGTVKSLLGATENLDDLVGVNLKYDNKYEYQAFNVAEKNDGSGLDFYAYVSPLESVKAKFIAEVPKQIDSDGKPIQAILTIGGKEYNLAVRN